MRECAGIVGERQLVGGRGEDGLLTSTFGVQSGAGCTKRAKERVRKLGKPGVGLNCTRTLDCPGKIRFSREDADQRAAEEDATGRNTSEKRGSQGLLRASPPRTSPSPCSRVPTLPCQIPWTLQDASTLEREMSLLIEKLQVDEVRALVHWRLASEAGSPRSGSRFPWPLFWPPSRTRAPAEKGELPFRSFHPSIDPTQDGRPSEASDARQTPQPGLLVHRRV